MHKLNKILLIGTTIGWTALADVSPTPASNKPCSLAGGPGFGTAMGRPSCPTLDYAIRLCGTIYDTAHAIGGNPEHHSIVIWPQNFTLQGADAETQVSLDGVVLRLGCVFGDNLPQAHEGGETFIVKKFEPIKF